jgi:hypothetical protein
MKNRLSDRLYVVQLEYRLCCGGIEAGARRWRRNVMRGRLRKAFPCKEAESGKAALKRLTALRRRLALTNG